MQPDLIITLAFAAGATIVMVLMGTEVIHNQQVVDKLLITIPAISALIAGYWFNKNRNGGRHE
jgi:hypothetical protein